MKAKIFLIVSICNLLIFNLQSFSNNIQVNNATLINQSAANNYTYVQFDLTWENSWRDAVNWDAAWVFVKFKASYDTVWKHCSLGTVAGNHVIPGGYTGTPTSDGVGIYIYRSANGNGNVSLPACQIRWRYGNDGVSDGDLVQVKVFAIEMVYIPQGNFYLGDGTTTNVAGQFSAGNTTAPLLISSENILNLGGTNLSNLGNRNTSGMNTPDDFNNIATQTLPAAFPKGFNNFYCMKYEISQGQYTEFLNTLTRTQQKTRVASNISTDAITNIYVMANSSTTNLIYRNVIICPSSGNGTTQPIIFSCTRPDRACNWIEWQDGAAYCDWAGLRPMTSLEFEKVCRGPMAPFANEFAWGSTNVTSAATISSIENGTETITNAGANCNFGIIVFTNGDGSLGPLRCGIFAKTNTTREQAGATYYGVMDMSGNLIERTVALGNSAGRLFDGSNGDGIISPLGNANVINWPGLLNGELTGTLGSGERGGCWHNATGDQLRISDRSFDVENITGRSTDFGFRCVRTSEIGTMGPNGNNPRQK